MAITLICSCGAAMHAPDDAAGKRGRCKACGAVLTIPASGEAVSNGNGNDRAANLGSPRTAPPPISGRATAASVPTPPPLVPAGGSSDDGADDLSAIVGARKFDARRTGGHEPPEPWYYERLNAMGRFWRALGQIVIYGGVGIGAVVTALGIARTASAPSDSGEEVFYGVFAGVGIMLSSMISGSPLYIFGLSLDLAVDAARNLRALRYSTESR